MKLYRHGDILFKGIAKPKKVKETESKKEHIVAYGEATGHHHKLIAENINVMLGFNEESYIEVLGSLGTLTHQEHNTLEIEPGCYEIVTEREWDYFGNERKKVID